ncbi:MAG: hypothetical protein ACXVCP_20060 [Bdellovibrio sp.]
MISLRTFFSGLSILLFAAIPLKSQATISSPLEDYAEFSSWFQSHTSFKCDEEYLQSEMAEEIPKVIFLGLQAIYDVNPELINAKLKYASKNKIKFTCIEDDDDRHWGALFDPTPFYISLDSFKFSGAGEMIILPKSVVRGLYVPAENLTALSTLRRTDKQTWLFYSYLNKKTVYAKNAVVHEYLHFLGFDNYSTDLHNSVTAKNNVSRFDDDLVYSCADLSFPTWTLQLRHGFSFKSGAVIGFDIGKACLICATAIDNGKKRPRLDDQRTKGALASCSSYHDLKY